MLELCIRICVSTNAYARLCRCMCVVFINYLIFIYLQCAIYLHVTSAGIIEGCKRITVAPYSDALKLSSNNTLRELFTHAQLNIEHNNWSKLNDFDWLNDDIHSPNWSILDESERKVFEL
jgi:hypothetical protein